ncbi:MAG: alkaline phosphatase family protein [Candidatus Tectomicrobia bacterium]|uniref:Alkaline phosphatase family protein n=1 Tax=Tectimicrobiota bacterium TaxID=2528274 RepID=A0A932CPR3_UNCTE|nr:alkaline phosphatase family protein [Candidatus Tectomicrobia bacterium]
MKPLAILDKVDKFVMIGLDCAEPRLVFEEYRPALPNLGRLMDSGLYGRLRSCHPPITVPAWTCMMTGKDPGRLGSYGFRNRSDYSYEGLAFANSLSVKEDTLWDIFSRQGKRAICLGIPQTYPPKPLNGYQVSCFLTPDTRSQYTYPADLRQEIEAAVGRYILDVEGFRTEDKGRLLEQIYQMTRQRFKLARYLLQRKEWDLFLMVEIGLDRIHHGFWKYADPAHRRHEPASPYASAIRDYYRYLDTEIGEILRLLPPKTGVLVVSDHGAQRMEGGICINEWLIQEGYLCLQEKPPQPLPFNQARVDWSRTLAWGEGGYYSRIFLNVQGREPQGTIEPARYEAVRSELIAKLEALGDENGKPIGTRVYRPEELYALRNGIPPDLIAYFGNLAWRSVGSVGLGTVHTFENDTGPDDANHAQHGILILSRADGNWPGDVGEQRDLDILDVAPTVLQAMGMEVPTDMGGRSLVTRRPGDGDVDI